MNIYGTIIKYEIVVGDTDFIIRVFARLDAGRVIISFSLRPFARYYLTVIRKRIARTTSRSAER